MKKHLIFLSFTVAIAIGAAAYVSFSGQQAVAGSDDKTEGRAKLVTNIGEFPNGLRAKIVDLKEEKGLKEIFDTRYIVYTKELAQRWALDPKNIGNLTGGLQALEVQIMTKGNTNECSFSFYTDSSLEFDLPDSGLYEAPNDMLLTNDADPKTDIIAEDKNFQEEKYENDSNYRFSIAFGSYHKGKPNMQLGSPIAYYKKESMKGLSYFERKVPCRDLYDSFYYSSPSLWIKKKGKKDYSVWGSRKLDTDDFYIFMIPEDFAKKIAPIAERAQQINREKRNGRSSY